MSNQRTLEELNKLVYGHERAKKVLITLVQRASMRYHQKWINLDKHPIETMNCLLVGDSGTGKTHLIESLQSIVKFPFLRIDATTLTPTGNNDGVNSAKLRKMLIDKANLSISSSYGPHSVQGALDKMVVFVDEIDKLANSFDSSGNWNKHVQANFLTLIDDKHDFSGVSWVFAGAFSSIEKSKTEGGMGFGSEKTTARITISDEEIIKSGLIPELVGRIGQVVCLDEFTKEDYTKLLNEVVLPKKYKDLDYCGITFEVLSEDEIDAMAEKTAKSGQGVRGLSRNVDNHYIEAEIDRVDRPALTMGT